MKNWLKELRINQSLTMLSLSTRLDISESYYCMIESGERNPSVTTAKKIAEVLGFDWTRFFENDTAKEHTTA